MNPSADLPSNTVAVDEDLAEQARPGHGVPSQDPDPAAQFPLEPQDAKREAHSVLVGAVTGALGGAAAGTLVKPEGSSRAGTAPAKKPAPVN